ncbi:DUF4190 domain-containing protein [Microterricola pindariensis]|uniref:DUF4190 domain-containing protein n=1 Tax=Microterricola pindariensis TaxID=478010 RepID=UPI001E565DC4|nr:DUF4190 domain-containing protein [Microterricola pindariensis]
MSATIPVVPSAPAEPNNAPTPPAGFTEQPYAGYAEQPGAGYAEQPYAGYTGQQPAASATPTQWLSISSLVLGITSIFAGWTFIVPVAGLILGILALQREPAARTMAIWGVVLNSVVLAGGLLVGLGALIFGLAALPFAILPFAMF